ncbi:MAG: hypothetical protein HY512_04105 [Candidatus Aenigmarchaeota archaeon]|nr:hypothetical protein [Candidatus Aenigmarchaeota archaeon]
MEYKLEITKKLEDLGDQLDSDDFVAILNLPDANLCSKRGEMVELPDGARRQACKDCITQKVKLGERLSKGEVMEAIDYFAFEWGTRFITVNGRGEVFHPGIREMTLWKIRYAALKGIQSYIFTPGNDLDQNVSRTLANYGVNVMMSLRGNPFIDADFFDGKTYSVPDDPSLQNPAMIAGKLRGLIMAYKESPKQSEEGTTRIGMNYSVSEDDLKNPEKLRELKESANTNGIFFVCNTDFKPHTDKEVQAQLGALSREYTDFHQSHSTGVNGQCQMGAGSSATVDFDGRMFRCPYFMGKGDGKFQYMTDEQRKKVVTKYITDREFACALRRTLITV